MATDNHPSKPELLYADAGAWVSGPCASGTPAPAVLPAAMAHNRLQAYEDAIRYRQIMLNAHCADCGEVRCPQHEADERLIGQYQAHFRQLSETMAAEREASIERIRAARQER